MENFFGNWAILVQDPEMSLWQWLGFKDRSNPLHEGARIPRLQVMDDEGHLFYMDEVGRKGWILVYFYPKADTPGCTAQACSLRDHHHELTSLGVRIYGVSRDNVAVLKKFKTKFSLPFSLISDFDSRLMRLFGVPKWFGFASRQAFLFRDGILIWRDLVGSTQNQADEVLRAIRERN